MTNLMFSKEKKDIYLIFYSELNSNVYKTEYVISFR